MPIASVATIILQESFGSLNRCACNNFVPNQNKIPLALSIETNKPGGNDP